MRQATCACECTYYISAFLYRASQSGSQRAVEAPSVDNGDDPCHHQSRAGNASALAWETPRAYIRAVF